MKPLLETMKQYNKVIASWNRAEEFFAREDITLEEKQSRADDCKLLINHLNGLIIKVRNMGYNMTDEEIMQGFRQVEALNL